MKKGIFISIEGTDGSGKTTQLKLIEQFFREKKYDIMMLREPGGSAIGEKIRQILLDTENIDMTEETEMFLYAASRAQLVKKVINPAIDMGKIVVCDRFVDSSLVYQGVGRGLGMDRVLEVNNYATLGTMPDLTLFLELDPVIAFKRRIEESGTDRLEMEGIDFQTKVFNAYKELGKKFENRIRIIDASKPVEDVFENIRYWLERLLDS